MGSLRAKSWSREREQRRGEKVSRVVLHQASTARGEGNGGEKGAEVGDLFADRNVAVPSERQGEGDTTRVRVSTRR